MAKKKPDKKRRYKYYIVKVFQRVPTADYSDDIKMQVKIPDANVNSVLSADYKKMYDLHKEERIKKPKKEK